MKANKILLGELENILQHMLRAEQAQKESIASVLPANRNSAINLVDYLALRSIDIEGLQLQLHNLGLSSLASSEGHIKSQLLQVMEWLGQKPSCDCEVDADSGLNLLNENIKGLLGVPNKDQTIPVMVTFDTNFAYDVDLLCDLLVNGMRVARINCAHDDQDIWGKMLDNLDLAKEKTNLSCKVIMDLAGPKIRTQIITKKHQHGKLKVKEGDEIILMDLEKKGKKQKHVIFCTQSGIIENLEPGHRVFFDDGLFESTVKRVDDGAASICITRIAAAKPVIKSDKGINFPDTNYKLAAVTGYDRECLSFIVRHADMVGFSFVNGAADMKDLQNELGMLGLQDFPIVAKIETGEAVDHLPAIILQGMEYGPVGVMVARGDMAVEIGFERMSEIQDEILWICEAAHTPVIWATQVLESMHKQGIATRAEITDAAHAAQADCVMINKGGFTVEVLQTLNDILSRSRRNYYKNRRLFRKLSIATNFMQQHTIKSLVYNNL